MTDVMGGLVIARARWRAAEDRLYPTLLADPSAYQRGIAAVQAVVGELRRRDATVADLVAFETEPDELLGAACSAGVTVPVDLLVAVACGIRDRELSADESNRRRSDVIDAARAAGAAWAVLEGPADAAELSDDLGGHRVALHLASGAVVEAVIDLWAREDPYQLTEIPGDTRSFADRDAWLAELRRIESAGPGGRQGEPAGTDEGVAERAG